ncbi:1-acyl-sn-glycerol-3-phosphate acyltransferase [Litorivicinus lipolyticus]|uniref:1-acyl-sn-glycerol-3-phosphate acyltransferase n=1 Tax=Litorivicinus lipolyticus TaxID=418701 RepID=A0A5Q2QCA7_9GAMM|nr:1-acyl-sn-glycerol-3-phosphate acyltransferase [Litorivicinus lipolyticus]QGG80744.1 1-acyl-sn-glycerol-3-phosphate acyltransferase [Litorivicinus lipolyticus]
MTHDFSNIAPYSDADVKPALARLLDSPPFLAGVARLGMPRLSMIAPGVARFLTRNRLRSQFSRINTIEDLQNRVAPFMTRVVKTTIDDLVVEGLDALPQHPCLFISNHRDIVMDPALVNWSLHSAGRDTVRIAIGDNLIKQPFVEDLMRLNKSFIVRRNVAGPRELAKVVGQLSAYIGHSITHENQSVWLAQKEGRAKDGIDRTDPAILKMVSMAGRKHADGVAGYLATLHIVPVYISYEIDPCDSAKAVELWKTALEGGYDKADSEDLENIVLGIKGHKGRVKVAFGTPITDPATLADPSVLAAAIDNQMRDLYEPWETNQAAASRLRGHTSPSSKLDERLAHCPEAARAQLIKNYAAPELSADELAHLA